MQYDKFIVQKLKMQCNSLSSELPHSETNLLFSFIEAQADATAKRKVDVRIYDRRYTASKEEVDRKLLRALLTERGYKRTTAFTQSAEDGRGEPLKILRYQKTVPCQDMTRVEKELRRNIPGVWGSDVSVKVREEAMKKREKGARCDAGIEIHYPTEGCQQQGKHAKRAIPSCTVSGCTFCFFLTVQ